MELFVPNESKSFGENLEVVTKYGLSESAKKAASYLSGHTDIQMRFSEARCSKALPQALAAYKEGLHPNYNEEFHNAKVRSQVKFTVPIFI